MVHEFQPGDFLIFQLESGYGLLRVIGVDEVDGAAIWHLAAYADLFLDPDAAERAVANAQELTLEKAHVALTNRAFESTPVSRLGNLPLTIEEEERIAGWRGGTRDQISDRSIRLMLGLR